MKFTIAKKEFVRAATIAANAAAKKSPIASLTSVKIDVGSGMRVSGTDLYTGASVSADAISVHAAGSITVPAKQLVDALRGLADGDVTAEASEGRFELRSGRGRQRMPYSDASEYPLLPEPSDGSAVYVPAEAFASALSGVAHSMSLDESTPHVNGIHVDIGRDRIRAAATDGKTLARCDVRSAAEGSVTVMVPQRSVSELRRTLDAAGTASVGVSVFGATLFVETPSVTFSAKLSGTDFIAGYERLIPEKSAHRIVVEREMFADAVKRVTATLDPALPIKIVVCDGSVSLSSSHSSGDAHDAVDVDYAGPEVSTMARASYMVSALAATKADTIAIAMGRPIDPIVITPVDSSDHVLIVMPVQK